MKSVGILGTGYGLPSRKISNHDFAAMGLETSDEWITARTGIKTRYIADDHTTSATLGEVAARMAIEKSGLTAQDIDLVICATTSPEYPLFPSNACLLQQRLGLGPIGAFDLSAACSGFSYAMTTAAQYIVTGAAKNVLVVATDCLSKYVDWTDRSICVLFGDGAGAVVLSEVPAGQGLCYSKLYSNGAYGDILCVQPNVLPERIQMNGRAVFKVAIENVIPAVALALTETGLTSESLTWFIPHQANLRIIQMIAEKLHIADEKIILNLAELGNTSAASIPIAIAQAAEKGQFREGDTILTVGFGAGFTWGVNILKWTNTKTKG